MKILQLGYSYQHNAQGAITKNIEKKLLEENIESMVLFSEVGTKSSNKAIQCNPFILSFLSRILNKIFGRKTLHFFFQTNIAIGRIKKYKPDLVQIHVIHHCYYNYKKLFQYFVDNNIPVVFTLHDMWIMTGGCYHFFDIACKKYLSNCIGCPGKDKMDCKVSKTSQEFSAKKQLIESMNITFVAVSDWVNKMTQNSIIEKKYLTTICNGIDTKVFSPRKQKADNLDIFVICAVANEWSKDKGIFDLYKLAEKLDNNYKFVLVGNCSKELKQNAPLNVEFIGQILTIEEMANFYRNCDLFIHLSICETFGMVIAEAACCGLPVIGYRATGIKEVINRVGGTLVKIGDVNKIANIIVNYKKSGQINQYNVEKFINTFSIENMADEYVNLYKKIIKESI